MKWTFLVLPVGIILIVFSFSRQPEKARNNLENEMVIAANNFLQLLDKDQKMNAKVAFDSDERFNWHYFPKNNRKGIALKDMNATQREAAMVLLKSALSAEGFQKTKAVIELEAVLRQMENRGANDEVRDPGKYYFTIFGEPSEQSIWGWRLEGHHLSLNFSSANNLLVSGTPGFLGSNPAIVPSGPEQGKQILKEETAKAFALLHSLDKNQLDKAIVRVSVPDDIITFVSRKANIDVQQGIAFGELNNDQQEKFTQLLRVYVDRYKKSLAEQMLQDIKNAGMNKLSFVWIGAQQPGKGNPHYYRIQGPTVIIEYDNTQNNANHIHTVVRDLHRDFGGDALLAHYKNDHNQMHESKK
jgi:Protein of unknown function (DUF3500)